MASRIPHSFQDPRQERIHIRLSLAGPGPAAFYQDACELMAMEPPLSSASHQVAHLLREIESGLLDLLRPPPAKSATPQRDEGESSSQESRKVQIRAILQALAIDESDDVAQAWLGLELHQRAHRSGLAEPRPLDGEFRRFWDDVESILDAVLDRFEATYAEYFRQVDEILQRGSISQAVKELSKRIPNNPIVLGHFFDELDNPDWIPSLAKNGLFKNPPPIEQGGGALRFIPWPAGRYLSRMAAEAPSEVLQVMLGLSETDNPLVHAELIDAALSMPPELVIEWACCESDWAARQDELLLFVPEKLGELASHMLRGDQVDCALRIATGVLGLCRSKGNRPSTSREVATPRFDSWEYGQLLEKHLDAFVHAEGMRTLRLLCRLLKSTVGESPSWFWRPAIEEHAQNSGGGVTDTLVAAVRDTAGQLVRGGLDSLETVVVFLESRSDRLFHRIALHVLRTSSSEGMGLIEERLTDRSRFEDVVLHHEYSLLLQTFFERLSCAGQNEILTWIDQGPDTTSLRDSIRSREGRDPTSEELSGYAESWRRNRLAMIRGALPPEWRERFESLVKRLGVADHPEFLSYTSSGSWGPISPTAAEDIRALDIDALLDFITNWNPEGGFGAPSIEGLGKQLSRVVSENPDVYGKAAPRFRDQDPTYVRSLLEGLTSALGQEHSLEWSPVLALCEWVSRQPPGDPNDFDAVAERDLHWGWARKSLLSLISAGLEECPGEVPILERSSVWAVIERLSIDPDPSPAREQQSGDSDVDPISLSGNTMRGAALRTVLGYCRWILRAERESDLEGLSKHSMPPEAALVLDAHLDKRNDPSLSVHAFYGWWLSTLYSLDPDWAGSRVERIFPNDPSCMRYRRIAWDAFVLFNDPHPDLYRALKNEYEWAVANVVDEQRAHSHLGNPDRFLAEHLIMLYMRGTVSFDESGGLLGALFTKAPLEIRRYAIEFGGRVLCNTARGTEIPDSVLDRLRELWSVRLGAAESPEHAGGSPDELIGFGWWFASARLGDQWSLEQLHQVLALGAGIEPEHMTFQKLASLSREYPLLAVRCLREFSISSRVPGWKLSARQNEVREILTNAFNQRDPITEQEARELVSRLAALGHTRFTDLLSPATEDNPPN